MIEALNVHYSYPNKVEALKGVSLTIKDGEFVAIMGQNGAGKSTFVKHFNGLLKPSVGTVKVNNVETTKTSVATLARNVGFVFQNPDHQLFSETVEDEVAFALKNFGFEKEVIEKRIDWALNLLSLTQYRKTSPFLLSGGERKRVALASVLAWDPETLVLDEPTIGQDHEQKEKLRQFILQMQTQGKTVVAVTHDVEFVAECNPRVVLMKEGKIVADGMGNDILTDPVLLEQASIVLPQIAQVFTKLSALGLPKNIIDIYEAKEIILKAKERRGAMSVFDGLRFRKVYSPIHNLDPRIKFVYVIAVFVVAILFSQIIPLLILFVMQIPFVLLARVQRQWLRSLRGAAFLAAFIFIINVATTFFTTGYHLTAAAIESAAASDPALRRACRIFQRFLS